MTGKRQKLAAALDAAVAHWCSEPFVWGHSDCLMALADVIMTARGYDPAAEFRGRYVSAIGAARVTRRFGGFAGALDYISAGQFDEKCRPIARSRWYPIDPRRAAIGDIGIVANAAGLRCGVMRYHRNWIGRGAGGFALVSAAQVVKAWRVS